MRDRWLLDNDFPKPVFANLAELDGATDFVHFADAFPADARSSTPDWMIYLLAEAAGFVGVVTRDRRQLEDEDSMVVLSSLTVSVVTWRRGVDDPATLWGQLVAYMPQVRSILERAGPGVVVLPSPTLPPRALVKASDLGTARQRYDQLSWPERKSRSTSAVRQELRRRRREDLGRLLLEPGTTRRRR